MFKYGVVFVALWFSVASAEIDVAALENQLSSMIETIDQLKTELWKTFDEKVAYKMSQAEATESEDAIKCTEAAAQDARDKINAYVGKSHLTATENVLKQAHRLLEKGDLDSTTKAETTVKNALKNFERAITEYNMKFTNAGIDLALVVIGCLKK